MKKKEESTKDDVQVHVLKNGLYADRDEIMNHPNTEQQLKDVEAIMRAVREAEKKERRK